ncbi:MAG: hypothetical protein ACRDJC_05675, partial [Thermomicrobiales bacterium]
DYSFPPQEPPRPPVHRMWAIEYHCSSCRPLRNGRFFKKPDADDLLRFECARTQLEQDADLLIPNDEIPPGDETQRLHRWGYQRYREMFNERQLLGLGLLLRHLRAIRDDEVRHALLTVFSDFLRYQNMLCRYDTYALKCQDIFSVHGFRLGSYRAKTTCSAFRASALALSGTSSKSICARSVTVKHPSKRNTMDGTRKSLSFQVSMLGRN